MLWSSLGNLVDIILLQKILYDIHFAIIHWKYMDIWIPMYMVILISYNLYKSSNEYTLSGIQHYIILSTECIPLCLAHT